MTRTVEGVRDPLQFDNPDEIENAVVRSAMLPKGFDDTICEIDGAGFVRHPETGRIQSLATITVIDTDVDPETWGEEYHHPYDCPEKDPPASDHTLRRSTCEWCTVAAEREHDKEHYQADREPMTDAGRDQFLDLLESMAAGTDRQTEPVIMTGRETAEALEEELDR